MVDNELSKEKILAAAEELLRRYGLNKTTVTDVAHALGVTHGSVYRYFPSKAALREAVAEHWLSLICPPLQDVVESTEAAPERLRKWIGTLVQIKRQRAAEDPELFAVYAALASDSGAVHAHLDDLAGQAAEIIADGIAKGDFTCAQPLRAARAILLATTRFQHPAHAAEWSDPHIDTLLEDVWDLLIDGLKSRSS